jgi:hypothetical protein
MDVTLGALGLGAVMGWQLPVVRRTSWSTALASTLEIALAGVPVFMEFGPNIAGLVVTEIAVAGVIHATLRMSLAARCAKSEGRDAR